MRQPPFCGEGGETPFAGRRWQAATAPLIGELSANLTERLIFCQIASPSARTQMRSSAVTDL